MSADSRPLLANIFPVPRAARSHFSYFIPPVVLVFRINLSVPDTISVTFMPCEGCGGKGAEEHANRGKGGGGRGGGGLRLCTLPAFTLVSLYQLDNGLMKHDRTSFHGHVGANASKCWQLHCFVARGGEREFLNGRATTLRIPMARRRG